MFSHKSSIIDIWLGSKYASEAYFSATPAFPLFPWSKEPFEVNLKRNPLKQNWLLLRLLSGGKKASYIKKEKNSLSAFSRCKKTLFGKWIFHYFFFYNLKASCCNLYCSAANFVSLTSVFEGKDILWNVSFGSFQVISRQLHCVN